MTGAITTTGVTWRAPGGWSLAVPDLAIPSGALTAVTGATRSGKSTLVHLLAGWQPPSTGRVEWPGPDRPPLWSQLAVVPQRLALVDELTIEENVRLPLLLGPNPVAEGEVDDVEAVVDALDLGRLLGRRVDELSIGERQRVMVARALAGRPAILLADEPVAHQDERRGAAVLDLLDAAAGRGATVVLATREPAIAERATSVVRLG